MKTGFVSHLGKECLPTLSLSASPLSARATFSFLQVTVPLTNDAAGRHPDEGCRT